MTTAISVQNLYMKFNHTLALDGASFEVRKGEIFGLLGPNGAGKTTTIKILLSLLRPTGGSVRISGVDVLANPQEARKIVGWVPQETAVDRLLTGRENLYLIAGLYHIPPKAARPKIERLLEIFDLTDAADRVVSQYSGGMKKRLEIAAGLLHEPAVLLLDEPTLGLDIHTRRKLWDYIRLIKRSGTTILLTSHYLEEADALCDRVAIIHKGKIMACDSPAHLKAEYGQPRIRVEPAEPLRPEQLQSYLRALSGVGRLSAHRADPHEIRLDVDDPFAATKAALAEAEKLGIPLKGVSAVHTSLDDVFIKITGSDILEANAVE
ncbi:MAG TPA: ATP-binding cassette domain-containing protein [Paenibacillaceae bacterium]